MPRIKPTVSDDDWHVPTLLEMRATKYNKVAKYAALGIGFVVGGITQVIVASVELILFATAVALVNIANTLRSDIAP